MSFAAVGGAAIGLVGTYLGNKSQKNAQKKQQQAMDQQAQVAKDQLDFSKQQYNDWKSMYNPAITQLGQEAQREIRPDYDAVAADVGSAYDASQGIQSRNMERYGIKPTDGGFQDAQTQYGLGRALATVQGDQNARQFATQQHWNRLAGFAGMGAGQQGALLGSMANASGALGGAYGSRAGYYGGLANQYGQSAMAGAGMLGRGISGMFGAFGNGGSFSSPSPAIDTPGIGGFDIPNLGAGYVPPPVTVGG